MKYILLAEEGSLGLRTVAMLYEKWRETVRDNSHELALRELPSGRTWTFEGLAKAAEQFELKPDDRLVFPTGGGVDFLLKTLAAWREGRVVCPLETGQQEPGRLTELPPRLMHLKLTSATTGHPRLVGFTAEQLMADAANIVATMGLRPDWPNLTLISLSHSYGFSNLALPLFLHGIPLVLTGSSLPETLRRAAAELEAITLPGVPALWKAWHEAGAIPATTRLAISAGAALPLLLEQAVFEMQGIKIHNFYGSSECGGIAYDRSDSPRTDPTCVGSPMEGVRVSQGEDGCVEVRGAAVGLGYFPDASAELRDGVFRSQDLGEIQGGNIHLRGRASDLINVAGRKFSPEVVERVLYGYRALQECVVFGVPAQDLKRGESVVACVAVRNPGDLEDLKRYAMANLPPWQVPREWWLAPDLRPTERGKLSRARWRAQFLER